MEYQAIDPLCEVEQVETDIQQLSHLCRVYLLVIDCVRWQALTLACEDNPEEVNRCKSLEWDKVVVDKFHKAPKNEVNII